MLQRGPKLFLTWALGANLNTKFRLIGPWQLSEAEDIMREELWETITRRGGFFGELFPFLIRILPLNALPSLMFPSSEIQIETKLIKQDWWFSLRFQ